MLLIWLVGIVSKSTDEEATQLDTLLINHYYHYKFAVDMKISFGSMHEKKASIWTYLLLDFQLQLFSCCLQGFISGSKTHFSLSINNNNNNNKFQCQWIQNRFSETFRFAPSMYIELVRGSLNIIQNLQQTKLNHTNLAFSLAASSLAFSLSCFSRLYLAS